MLTSNRTRPAPLPGRRFHPASSTALLAVLVLASVAVQETEATAQDAVSCPPGQVVGPGPEPGERLCYAYTSGGVLPIDQPLRVTAPAGGGVGGVRIVRSSGSPVLDKAALETVRRAAPFPAIPESAGRSNWPFTVPLAFAR